MSITLEIQSSNYGDVRTLAKSYAKENGLKVKDMGDIRLSHQPWGIAMTIFNTDGEYVTNVAL